MWKRIAALFCVSAATLAYEVALTRVLAVAQWYHFGFISIGVALLGFGASGSFLARWQEQAQGGAARREALVGRWALLFSLAVLLSYVGVNYIPFDSYRIAWEPIQFGYLIGYYLLLVLPFFFSGLVAGHLLSVEGESSHLVYGANLVGAALGSLGAWALLTWLGESGAVIAAALLGACGALPALWTHGKALWRVGAALLVLGCLAGLVWDPPFFHVRMSPYKTLSQALRVPEARIAFWEWNAFSRVQVIESPSIRSAPGLSLAYDRPLPPQAGLIIDGSNLQPITRWDGVEDMDFVRYLPSWAIYGLQPHGRALILSPGGGLAVQTALLGGAGAVVAVEPNPLVARLLREDYGDYAGHIYDDPRTRLVVEDVRAFMRTEQEAFDIIEFALSDTWRPVASGAYSLSEDYTLTREAFGSALAHLAPGGILAATRWLQYPPSEGLRLGGLMIQALLDAGVSDPGSCLLAFRSWSTLTVLAKPDGFSPEQVAWLRDFGESRGFDLVHVLGMDVEEANRHNVYESPFYYLAFQEMLSDQDRPHLYRRYEYDITPPTDDRPFFFHFFRWRQMPQVLQLLGKTWQPFGGSGYLVLLIFLGLALAVSTALILLPLQRGGLSEVGAGLRLRVAAYFAALGLGYLLVEIALIQWFVLLLGRPVYAFSLVLFGMLLSSGVGSLAARRISWRAGMMGILALLLVYAWWLPQVFHLFLGHSLAVRAAITVLILAPPGFVMGLPMAQGILMLSPEASRLRAWAWGINGFASVLASVLAMIMALSWGYMAVWASGLLAYLVALVALLPLAKSRQPPTTVH